MYSKLSMLIFQNSYRGLDNSFYLFMIYLEIIVIWNFSDDAKNDDLLDEARLLSMTLQFYTALSNLNIIFRNKHFSSSKDVFQ